MRFRIALSYFSVIRQIPLFGSYTRKCFCKRLARAGRRIAEEAAHLDEQSNGASLAGQIRKLSCVPTMNAAGGLTTLRTKYFREGRLNDQGQNMVLDEDVFQKEMGRERKQLGKYDTDSYDG